MIYPPPRSDRWDPWVVSALLKVLSLAAVLIHGL
jgi:hypothetical protein